MTNTTTTAQAFTARQPTPLLIESLRGLDAKLDADPKHKDGPAWRMSRSWILSELERRYPDASDAVGQAFDEWQRRTDAGENVPDVDYAAVLIANIPA